MYIKCIEKIKSIYIASNPYVGSSKNRKVLLLSPIRAIAIAALLLYPAESLLIG